MMKQIERNEIEHIVLPLHLFITIVLIIYNNYRITEKMIEKEIV